MCVCVCVCALTTAVCLDSSAILRPRLSRWRKLKARRISWRRQGGLKRWKSPEQSQHMAHYIRYIFKGSLVKHLQVTDACLWSVFTLCQPQRSQEYARVISVVGKLTQQSAKTLDHSKSSGACTVVEGWKSTNHIKSLFLQVWWTWWTPGIAKEESVLPQLWA